MSPSRAYRVEALALLELHEHLQAVGREQGVAVELDPHDDGPLARPAVQVRGPHSSSAARGPRPPRPEDSGCAGGIGARRPALGRHGGAGSAAAGRGGAAPAAAAAAAAGRRRRRRHRGAQRIGAGAARGGTGGGGAGATRRGAARGGRVPRTVAHDGRREVLRGRRPRRPRAVAGQGAHAGPQNAARTPTREGARGGADAGGSRADPGLWPGRTRAVVLPARSSGATVAPGHVAAPPWHGGRL